MKSYNPFDWFWIVGGDERRAWSSAAGAYVETFDESSATRIVSEAELSDVLRPYGLQGPHISQTDYAAAIEKHIETVAAAKAYSGTVSLASYVNSSVPQWAAEAQAFVAWRDEVWIYAYGVFGAVQAGQIAIPSIPDFIAALPPIAWPK